MSYDYNKIGVVGLQSYGLWRKRVRVTIDLILAVYFGSYDSSLRIPLRPAPFAKETLELKDINPPSSPVALRVLEIFAP
jgi:hypothetical protein